MATAVRGLDYWAMVTGDEAKCAFYDGVLGLKVGPRPQLTFKGIWFYSGDVPVVHVISGWEFRPGQTGAFDHIAFSMEGSPQEMEQKLAANNIPFQSRLIKRTSVYQIACKDPDGCGVELNFQGIQPS